MREWSGWAGWSAGWSGERDEAAGGERQRERRAADGRMSVGQDECGRQHSSHVRMTNRKNEVWVEMVTPFEENGVLDVGGVKPLMDWYGRGGAGVGEGGDGGGRKRWCD